MIGSGIGMMLLVVGAALFVLIYGMRLRATRNERLFKLYERALDQGLDPRTIQFDLEEREVGDPKGNLKAGVILLATALAIVLGMLAIDRLPGPMRFIGFALVPASVGLACLFIHFTMSNPKAMPSDKVGLPPPDSPAQ